MTTDTPSAEALAEHLTTLWHATGIGSCASAAAMLRSLASERDALRAALDAERERRAKICDERQRWGAACEKIARDLRNNDMVRLGAAKCLDAGLQLGANPPQQEPTA